MAKNIKPLVRGSARNAITEKHVAAQNLLTGTDVGTWITNQKSGTKQNKTVKFGTVTVAVSSPAKTIVKRNVAAGRSAMRRVKNVLLKPGVIVEFANGIPVYHVDSKNPEQIIQRLNGKLLVGKFVKGKFKPL